MRRPSLPSSPRLLGRSWAVAVALLAAGCEPEPPRVPTAGPPAPIVEYLARQEILTPLPLRVQLPARYGAERLFVLFRTWGSRDWDTMELARTGQTWQGQISCRQVSTVTGDTRYFFVALDGRGEIVAGSGSPEWPHVATIVGSIPGGPQALPGQAPPARCHDVADCPPDFPGCPAYTLLRPPCASDADCEGGRCSWDHYCDGAPEPQVTAEADSDVDPEADDEERLAAAVRKLTGRYRAAGVARPRP